MPNFGSGRLGFWFRPNSLLNACDAIPTYLPNIVTGEIDGLTPLSNITRIIQNNYLKVALNGNGAGAIGDGFSNSLGIKFDPNGNSNYGVDDFVSPAVQHDAFAFEVSSVDAPGTFGARADLRGRVLGWIISDNYRSDPPLAAISKTYITGYNTILFRINWTPSKLGMVTAQYKLIDNEPVLRMKYTYTNPSSEPRFIRMIKSTDPDQDRLAFGSVMTNSTRGYSGLPVTDVVYSIGKQTGKAITIYNPGNGYVHNTSIIRGVYIWPKYTPDDYFWDPAIPGTPVPAASAGLYPISVTNDDSAIGAVWKIGIVQPGESAVVCCYYIFGNNVAETIKRIEGRA